jgi:hypothetical protein
MPGSVIVAEGSRWVQTTMTGMEAELDDHHCCEVADPEDPGRVRVKSVTPAIGCLVAYRRLAMGLVFSEIGIVKRLWSPGGIVSIGNRRRWSR